MRLRRLLTILGALLLLLVLYGSSVASGQPLISQQLAPATPGWTPIYSDAPGIAGAGLNDPSEWVDGAGNLFVGWMHAYVQPSATYYDVRRYSPQGQQTGEWHVQPDGGWKADGGQITPTGSDLLVVLTAHGSGDQRPVEVGMQRIAGVFAPYAQGIPAGAPGAQIPPGQAEVALTMDDLVAALNNASSPLSVALDRHVKNNSQIGAQRAIGAAGVVTTGNIRDTLYQFEMDRIYQTFDNNAPGYWPWLRKQVNGNGGR